MQNSHVFYSTSCFRHLPRQRTLQNSSELCKFCAIRPHSPRITRNSHILLTYSTPISGTCTGRERSGIPANYANSAQFAHTVQNYAKFAPFANTTPYVSDAWPVAENSLKFQRIKRNSLNSPTYLANYVNSTHFSVN